MQSIDYTQYGSGRTVVLLHGFCETQEIWRRTALALAAKWHVVTPDLPGFGKSSSLPENFTIDDAANVIADWLMELGQEKPVVIGHSLGGYVTLALAARASERLSGAGLFHSTAAEDTSEKKESRNKVIAFVQKHGVKAYTDNFVAQLFRDRESKEILGVQQIAETTPLQTLTGYAKAMRDRPSRLEFIRGYHHPMLFAAGEFDEVIPVAAMRAQAQSAVAPQFDIITGAGHMGMLENEPESIKLIEKFLNSAFEKGSESTSFLS